MKKLQAKGHLDSLEASSCSDSNSYIDQEWKIAERVKKARLDVMSNVSVTGDRLGLSARKRACFAASSVSAVNVPVQQTNISVFTAWRKARAMRGECSSAVKENFECPDRVLIHWDGKILKVKTTPNWKKSTVIMLLLGSKSRQKQYCYGHWIIQTPRRFHAMTTVDCWS